LKNTEQLNLFEQPSPVPQSIDSAQPLDKNFDNGFAIGDRIQIVKAGNPFQHMNGQKGKVVALTPDAVSVQVEGVAVALMFRPEALEKWTLVSGYMSATAEAESVILFRVGDRVECHFAFIGKIGIVQSIARHCAATVAWVDYGNGKPLYPSSLEQLTLAE
jgi:hypothetical protein